MKYYLIAGEASGDLHASRLMSSLTKYDHDATFRFFGGDRMTEVGGTRVRHFRELAYMGFVPVITHLPTILRNMRLCRQDILQWKPDVVILVDYAGFNLQIARFVRKNTSIPVYYYISPKIWAWKEWRIRDIKKYVNEMFSILPFEKQFYEKRHKYRIHYVGNPTAEEVTNFKASYRESFEYFRIANGLEDKPVIALLAGSRKQEIKDNLPAMIAAAQNFADYQIVVAGAPAITPSFYKKYLNDNVRLITGRTYEILYHATAALVTSGTATLETALFEVPQVVCYKTPLPKLMRFGFNHIIKVPFISLVNLIDGKEVVKELFADRFKVCDITNELYRLLPQRQNKQPRESMIQGYRSVKEKLGYSVAPDNAARIMVQLLSRTCGI